MLQCLTQQLMDQVSLPGGGEMVLVITEDGRSGDFLRNGKEVRELMQSLEQLNSRPIGAIDLKRQQKRHKDWMRKRRA